MSQHANLLFSKIIDENNPQALVKYGITERDLATDGERATYRFIRDYVEKNGQVPSYATVTAQCPSFMHTPMVSDPYEYLAKQIKSQSAKNFVVDLVNSGKLADLLENTPDGNEALKLLQDELASAIISTNVRSKVGTDVKADSDKFLAEMDRRKAGESFKVWKSKFPFINETIGGYIAGNLYVPYGKSGRGKSVITLEEVLEAATQGANVLIWAMEMGWYEVLVRIYVSLSARRGLVEVTTEDMPDILPNGFNMAAGFDSTQVRYGKLSDEFDVAFRAFVEQLNDSIPGNIIVRAVDDDDFSNRTLGALEADILATNADVVMVDPFYYLDYEKNTSRTTGGDAAATSEKLRRLAGKTQTVIFAITQADETTQNEDEEGNRELELPQRKDVAKTKQLLQDAYLLIGVDTDYKQCHGIIGLNKGRDGGEGVYREIVYIPQVGIVREPETGPEAAEQFNYF
ncbi:DNA helicase [Bacillus sp. PK3-056]|uniref:AAA family ATPase n=1 Tax=Niallia circulans TaxID=1397 RepID=UPI000F44CC3C|nr:AAA family ATPase [Niallia circulans]AYV74279.1 DNA helicase [Niallia circulans]